MPAQNQDNHQKNISPNLQSQPQPAGIQKPATPTVTVPAVGSTTGISKERESVKVTSPEALEVEEVPSEVEISKEIERVGVKKTGEIVELPPDVKKIGVTPAGPATPVVQTTVLPTVILPISDKKVIKGLHEPLISALRWLATWCIKKLKKAHLALRVIHGKIIRVKTS